MASWRNPTAFSVEEVQEMLENREDGMYVLDILTSNIERTEVTLNETSSTEKCAAILQLLSLASKCTTGVGDIIRLLLLVKNSKLFKEELVIYLGVPLSSDEDIEKVCNVIRNCVQLLTQLSMRLPSAIVETFGLIAIMKKKLQEILPFLSESLQSDMLNASENVSKLQDEIMKTLLTKDQTSSRKIRSDDRAPPDDFHDIPILPRTSDIFLSSRVFLRANKSRGSYTNLQEYLDVQFRLYREDCISPLREGITEYIREQSAGRHVGRLQDGRLYKDVVATDFHETIDGLTVEITLDKKHSNKIRWKTSRRLLYGSLLCLSPDHFQTMYFAVVSESDRETLDEDGCFYALMANRRMFSLNKPLTMVESTAYFESYKHVLSGLQNIKDGDLPFEKYIVQCNKDVERPKYVDCYSQIYDFWPICSDGVIYKQEIVYHRSLVNFGHKRNENVRKTKNIDILTPRDQWPAPEELHLDESQFRAFHSALTQEFVLIQGPPGTGKTYVGLQIAKTLLHNRNVWGTRKEEEKTVKCPMLIVCYTNHALDQFVEGIIAFHDKSNDKWKDGIIRVGGRCGSQIVEEFSLKNKRHRHRHEVDKDTYAKRLRDMRQEIVQIGWRIKQTKTTVLYTNVIQSVIDEDYLHWFCKDKPIDKEAVSRWLGFTAKRWIKRTWKAMESKPSVHDDDTSIRGQESDVQRLPADETNEAQRVEDERRIEEDDFVVLSEKEEDIGLNIKRFLEDEILSTYENMDIDERFRDSLSEEAEEALRSLSSPDRMSERQIASIRKNRRNIPFKDRWSLYRYWVHKYIQKSYKELERLQSNIKDIGKKYRRELQETDARILKEATVIAMTTTGAARYHDVLNEVGPRIIIVEEAAEVLEAHIITALSSKCEHLILIGDHKQLEPKPTVYELAIMYNLGVSMFERMLNNGLSFHCLQRQHRMRPEISTLVRHIYSNLIDNENVYEYEHIGGVKKDVFFIAHNVQEQYRDDIRSYSNEHEAKYIMRLCKYLMLQGYSASQITVLAAYNGQMFCIRDLMPRDDFYGVRVSAIDNYQGEENDIILVSLVRSNTEGKIGFLGRDNRVCVTLSRAKKGMYVIGNFSIFGKGSSLWKKILQDVHGMESIGEALPLYCQVHPDKEGIKAKNHEDFDAAPEGGCETNCDFRLPCGHACRLKCHPIDREHLKYECKIQCRIKCPNGHICERQCHFDENCDCPVQMQKTLSCKHIQTLDCWKDPNEVVCRIIVQRILERCGHEAIMECRQIREEYQCQITISRNLEKCGHDATMKCCVDVTKYVCQEIVTRKLERCGHDATMKCCMDVTKYDCQEIVTRKLEKCGHDATMKCCVDVTKYECQEIVTRKLEKCGHDATMKCCVDVTKYECQQIISHNLECGHTAEVKCHRKHMTFRCKQLVTNTRPCGHEYQQECYISVDKYARSRYEIRTKCEELVLKKWKCGHSKDVKCFEQNRQHCTFLCLKRCGNDHECLKQCHFPSECNCMTMTEKKFPDCGHKQTMPCSRDPSLDICKTKVSKLFPNCEHSITIECGEDIEKYDCCVMVNKIVPLCGHENEMVCYKNPQEFSQCEKIISKLLACGHRKDMKCCQSIVKIKCTEIVERKLPQCDHTIEMKCHDDVKNKVCKKNILKTLPSCGHNIEMICSHTNFDDMECKHIITIQLPDCGHNKNVQCSKHPLHHQLKLRKNFHEYSHIRCKEACHRTRICEHPCTGSVCGSCTPCQGLCEMYCPHADCNHSCGKPCKQCTKKCTWSCSHYTCTKNCDEECDRPRCTKRCPKKLSCEHQCPGFCGEPCPWTCRKCQPTEWSTMVGSGKENDNVFIVRLPECDHEFNSCFLDECFDDIKKSTPLRLARCPTCSSVIRWHPRYGNILKQQRRAQRLFLELIHKHTKRSSIILKPNFHDIVSYIKVCNTFLLSQQRLIHDSSTEVYKQCQTTLNMTSAMFMFLDSVKRVDTSCQIINNTYHRMYLIAAQWQLIIAMTESLEDDNDDVSDEEDDIQDTVTQTVNRYVLGAQSEVLSETQIIQKTKPEDVKKEKTISSVKDILDGSFAITLDKLEKVQTILRPYITDVEQLAAATKYPVFEGVPGVHIDDWKICQKGHVEPSSSHRKICIHCEFGRSPDLGTFLRNMQPYVISQNVTLKTRATRQHKDKNSKTKNSDKCLPQTTNDSHLDRSARGRGGFSGGFGRPRPYNEDNSIYTKYKPFKGHSNRSDLKSPPENVRTERHSWRQTQMRPTFQGAENWRAESPEWRQKRSPQPVNEFRSNNESYSWRGQRTDTENWRKEFPALGENISPHPVREMGNDNQFNDGKRLSELNVKDDTANSNFGERHGYRSERGTRGGFRGQRRRGRGRGIDGRGRGGDGRGRRRQTGPKFGDFF